MPQEATRVKLGYQMAVRITVATGVSTTIARYFGVRGGTLEMDSDEFECGDTDSGINKRHKYGRRMFSVTLDFYEKDQLNIHDPPTSPTAGGWGIKNGDFIKLEIWTQGLVSEFSGDPLLPYTAPVFGVKNVRLSWTEDGKVEGTLTGKADGAWYRPGETIPP